MPGRKAAENGDVVLGLDRMCVYSNPLSTIFILSKKRPQYEDQRDPTNDRRDPKAKPNMTSFLSSSSLTLEVI